MSFQKTINDQQAPGVKGDFASTNPFSSVLAGQGTLVAPPGGLLVGNFFWIGPDGTCSQSFVAGWQVAFLGRNEQALITIFLGEASMLVPAGFPVVGFNGGDFWAQFEAGATVGQLVFADPNNGAPLAGATAPAGATSTASAGFTGTGTVTNGSAVLTINTATAGILSVGDTVTGTDIPSGTTILNQLTVTAGSGAGLLGTYTMSQAATGAAGPEAITSTSTVLDNTADLTGALNFGDVISGTGVTVGTTVGAQQAGFSGVATTAVSTTLTVTSVNPGSGLLLKGSPISGGSIPAAATIASQTSGTPGGVGVYVLSAAATVAAAGVPVQDGDTPGGIGQYTLSVAQNFASTTVTVAGTSQPTGFKVRGTYSPLAGEIGKISTL
jgi:hypothetical protein